MLNNKEYLNEYNSLISNISILEKLSENSYLSSPTLSKQETITFLYQRLKEKEFFKKKIFYLKIIYFIFFIRFIFL